MEKKFEDLVHDVEKQIEERVIYHHYENEKIDNFYLSRFFIL